MCVFDDELFNDNSLLIANMRRSQRTKLTKGSATTFRDFEVEFEPPTSANEDIQRLLQELILTDANVPVKLVFSNPFYENDSKSPPFSIVASEICGIKCDLIKLVHVYIGIKVLTSKTLSFQFHFGEPPISKEPA